MSQNVVESIFNSKNFDGEPTVKVLYDIFCDLPSRYVVYVVIKLFIYLSKHFH